jgi:hypothetical protein
MDVTSHLRIATIKGPNEDEDKYASSLGIPFGRPERCPTSGGGACNSELHMAIGNL